MTQIDVTIQNETYPIIVGTGVLDELGSLIQHHVAPKGDVVVVTNPTVGDLYQKRVVSSLSAAGLEVFVATVPDGEQYKRLDTVQTLYDRFLEVGLDRSGLVVTLGGGVVGDMAGFAAASYLRGVPFVQVPTTLLSMVDASVGGKTGVDLPQGKNLVGAFYQPKMVVIDPRVLASLAADELASGMAEVIKHGLIGNAELFEQLASSVPDDFETLVTDAVRVKVDVVQRDPFERGERALLNLGHTFGHAFELVSHYELKHGVAVGVGLVAAAKLAAELGHCDNLLVERIEAVVSLHSLKTKLNGYGVDEVVAAMRHDKKRSKKALRFIIPQGPGASIVLQEAPDAAVRAAVSYVLGD